MTVEEIQRVLRTICLERNGALQELESHPEAEMQSIITTLESRGLNYVRPSTGRTTLTFASFSSEDQEQVEGYAEMLINEAHTLCMRLQARCPILREGDNGELWELERVYKAQYHAMTRLRRRCDEGLRIRAHIRNARRWLEESEVECVN